MEVAPKLLTIDEYVTAVRHSTDGMANLVAALQYYPALVEQSNTRLKTYKDMERVNRLNACWISKTTQETLTAALAVAGK